MGPAAELNNITKRFGSVLALDDARLTLERGEVHALLGQNGAGKTTLGRILSGLVRPDRGTMVVDGRPMRFRNAADARAQGIAMVHQHFSLVSRFTGWDNIRLFNDGAWTVRGRPRPGYRATVEARAEELGLRVQLDEPVERLGVGERQRIEVLKALMSDTRILVLDEPTAVLTPGEVEGLFAVLRRVAASGTSICLIGHKLDEVLELADRVTVLREGRWAVTRPADTLSPEELAEAMIGPSFPSEDGRSRGGVAGWDGDRGSIGDGPRTGKPTGPATGISMGTGASVGDVVVSLTGVSMNVGSGTALDNVSMDVRRGEILGIAGVEGNGQRELASVLSGLRVPDHGTVRVPPRVGWVPQDRSTEGLINEFSLTENVALALFSGPAFRRGPFMNWTALGDLTRRLIADNDIRTPDAETAAGSLSGGNQQKLLTARELERSDDLLVAESPTRGLDVHAARAVRERILSLAGRRQPPAVVLISMDLDEVLALSTRIVVMFRGKIAQVPAGSRTRDAIGRMMLGVEVR